MTAYAQLALVLGLVYGAAADAFEGCDIRITGLNLDVNLNGNWRQSAIGWPPNDIDHPRLYYDNPALKYNGSGVSLGYDPGVIPDALEALPPQNATRNAWAILYFPILPWHYPPQYWVIARCTTAACVATDDLSKLPSPQQWEVASTLATNSGDFKPMAGSVSITCCPHKPNRCLTPPAGTFDVDSCIRRDKDTCSGDSCCMLEHDRYGDYDCNWKPVIAECLPMSAEQDLVV